MVLNCKNITPIGLLFLSILFYSSCTKKISPSIGNKMNLPNEFINVTIGKEGQGFGPCEPTIAISPLDPNFIAAGAVLDKLFISKDGGLTWKEDKLKSPYGVFGDPVIVFDNKGKLYYAHLSNPKGKAYDSEEFLDRIVVQTSSDGVNFSDGNSPYGNRVKDQDKHWLAVSPLDNTILMSWTEFDEYGSKKESCKSRIMFSLSKNQGESWSDALAISELEGDCIDDDQTTEGAVPAVGLDGTYFVVWSFNNKIYLDKSTDQGRTWMKADQLIADQPGGWTIDIPGINRCNGMPVLKIDHSNGPHKGHLYVSWTDQRNGETDTDVWVIKSTDQGKSWTKPSRVNDDAPGKQQFLSWMDVDPTTGIIYWVFYDRRNYSNNMTDVFIAYSTDGGKTFINKKISDSPFLPNSDVFFGDYNDISVRNGIVRPIWTRLHEGKLSVHTAIINAKQ
jgi:hypothetical protein